MDEGIGEICDGIARLREIRNQVNIPYYLSFIVEARLQLGDFANATRDLEEALRIVEQNDERCWQSELISLQAQMALKYGNVHDAQEGYKNALEVAKSQDAKSHELRIARRLALLWKDHNRFIEALDLMRAVYSWFTEGFETHDLVEARALMNELAILCRC